LVNIVIKLKKNDDNLNTFFKIKMSTALQQITGADGNLLPAKVVPATIKAPVLNIITPKSENNSESDLDSDTDDSMSDEEGDFYVEFSLTCTNEDGDIEDHVIVFNFGTESNYMSHAENGFDELNTYFIEAIELIYPGWTYDNEWDELAIHGSDSPTDYAEAIIDIE
jgi:hypothetical protein